MKDDTPIDFSVLDPKQPPVRFERMVAAVLTRLERPPEPWTRPIERDLVRRAPRAALLALALAVVPWIPALMQQPVPADAVAAESDPVEVVTAWAQADSVSTDPDEVRLVLGDLNER